MDISTLAHQELFRPGSASGGCTVAERCSSDFLIDDQSLLSLLVKCDGGHADFMGCLVKGFPEQNAKAAATLLLKAPPETDSGRVLLYICPECGDIGCGAYSVQLAKNDFSYIWECFAYENGYEEPRIIKGVGPFMFRKQEYESAIRHAAAL
jgi:hypothetical protein